MESRAITDFPQICINFEWIYLSIEASYKHEINTINFSAPIYIRRCGYLNISRDVEKKM